MSNYSGGFLIAFEGLDGSGLSTQADLLKKFLEEEGKEVLKTQEPTEGLHKTKVASEIQEVLDGEKEMKPRELQKLFVEDRRLHLDNQIKPALEDGKVVINDRYWFSTVAYGTAEGVDKEWLINQNKNFLMPNLTFLLKVSPGICVKRIELRGEGKTIFEKKKKLEKIWKVYEELWREYPMSMIDGEGEKEEVAEEIQRIVSTKLELEVN